LANPQTFSTRPNASLVLNHSVSGSTVNWNVTIYETAQQPSFSNIPANNTVSWNFSAGGGPSGSKNFTYTFEPAGLQTIVLESGSFNATSSSFVATASVSTTTLGNANVDQAIYPSLPPPPPPAPAFSDASVASSASIGVAYSDGVAASNSPSYSVVSGALPTGLSLNSGTGAITGTPTVNGTFTFVIRASNAGGSADTGTLTITVSSAARVWNGTAFVPGLANVWNGTAFVSGIIRVWDGTVWKNTN
jgi:hypothetical protein